MSGEKAIAKAMSIAKPKADPKPVTPPGGATKLYVGALKSPVAGRTDHLPVHVPSGSYVVPADIVSAIGEGNTEHGFEILNHMLKSRNVNPDASKAEGGPVAVVVAGGEFVIPPEGVAAFGGGDMDAGHKALDEWVKSERASTIKTLQSLPGPKRD